MKIEVTKNLVLDKNTFDIEFYQLEGVKENVGVIYGIDGTAVFLKISDFGHLRKKDGSALTEQDILEKVLLAFGVEGTLIKKLED